MTTFSDKHRVKVFNRGLRAFGQVQAQLLGYIEDKGYGGEVTQATNRTTAVTINKPTGVITTDDASLAAGEEATFTVNNTEVQANDVIVVSVQDKGATGLVVAYVSDVVAGSFDITLTNLDGATASTDAVVINYAIIRASNN